MQTTIHENNIDAQDNSVGVLQSGWSKYCYEGKVYFSDFRQSVWNISDIPPDITIQKSNSTNTTDADEIDSTTSEQRLIGLDLLQNRLIKRYYKCKDTSE